MIVFVRKFAKEFEYRGKCRHGLGEDDFALDPVLEIREFYDHFCIDDIVFTGIFDSFQ